MSSTQLEIIIIASLVSVACALPGVYLVLRRMALMSDAISHAILLGIVIAFFVTHQINSPFLILGASLAGLLLVYVVELVKKTGFIKEDAAIGLIFPVMFSIGVIMVSKFAGNVHLDTDAVLLGELAFAPFDRMVIAGYDIGARSMYVIGTICIINILFITIFYKELKLSTFDAGLAASLGISPIIMNYALMSVVSVTAVGSFDAVGSVLVVALMIAPPASAYLLTNRVSLMLIFSAAFALISALTGYYIAHLLDASIAGSIAVMTGIVFLIVFLFSPRQGIVSTIKRRIRQKVEFKELLLLIHILNHHNKPEAHVECDRGKIFQHLRWEEEESEKIINYSLRKGNTIMKDSLIRLTDNGTLRAQQGMQK